MYLIAICTGVLGLFLAFPLFALGRLRPANFWLGMFVMSIALLSMAGLNWDHPQLIGIFDWPVAGIGAYYYCYVRSIVGLGNSRRQAWHFVPTALWVLWLIWLRLSFTSAELLHRLERGGVGIFGVLLVIFQVLAGLYLLAVLYRLKQYRRRVRQSYASTRSRDLIWLSRLTCVILALLVAWMLAAIWGGYWAYCLVLGRLTTMFFVGWYGIRQAPVFLSPRPINPRSSGPSEIPLVQTAEASSETKIVLPVAEPSYAEPSYAEPTEAEKYARSGMTDAAQQLIGERLERRMSYEKDYLETDITLTDLAERIGTSPQLLSQYLNHVLGISFFDYINRLRIAEVQDMMRNPQFEERTLLELAFAAGFNSKSTFNASFKQICGTTPSKWRNMHAQTSVPIG